MKKMNRFLFITFLWVSCSSITESKEAGRCVMYSACGVDEETALSKSCKYDGEPLTLKNQSAIDILEKLCPNLNADKSPFVCCDDSQVFMLNNQMTILGSLFAKCPSCYHNLANVFCQLTCSPEQNRFLKVTNTTMNKEGKEIVNELSYYITETYAEGLFNSCKNVKLQFNSIPAIELVCGALGANCNPHGWLKYMGTHDPSPFQIDFKFIKKDVITVNSTNYYPMNDTIIPCSQPVSPGGFACCRDDCS